MSMENLMSFGDIQLMGELSENKITIQHLVLMLNRLQYKKGMHNECLK